MVGYGTLTGPQGTMEALIESQPNKYKSLVDHNSCPYPGMMCGLLIFQKIKSKVS